MVELKLVYVSAACFSGSAFIGKASALWMCRLAAVSSPKVQYFAQFCHYHLVCYEYMNVCFVAIYVCDVLMWDYILWQISYVMPNGWSFTRCQSSNGRAGWLGHGWENRAKPRGSATYQSFNLTYQILWKWNSDLNCTNFRWHCIMIVLEYCTDRKLYSW